MNNQETLIIRMLSNDKYYLVARDSSVNDIYNFEGKILLEFDSEQAMLEYIKNN